MPVIRARQVTTFSPGETQMCHNRRSHAPSDMKARSWLAVSTLLLIVAPVARAQPTAFTYQGQLKNGGSPASGSFDMTFRLFDDAVAGNQVGGDVPVSGVSVGSGLFTTQVDFGPGMFDGSPRWLEI